MVNARQRPDLCFPASFSRLFRLQPLFLGQKETTAVVPKLRNKAGRRQKSTRCLFLQGEQGGKEAFNPQFLMERLGGWGGVVFVAKKQKYNFT